MLIDNKLQKSEETPEEEVKGFWRRHILFLSIFWGGFLLVILCLWYFFHLVAAGEMGFMPTFEELENPNNRFASEVLFDDGGEMGRYFKGSENRRFTEYIEMPQSVIDALVSTEDERFYEHCGVDVLGLGRVAVGIMTGNDAAGGGSTISQQLAKMLFPRDPNQSFMELAMQKFREWVIAVRLEKSYTKEEIITMYLNKFDFLNLAVGINSAAEIYFAKSLDSLRIEEAAMLVGMAKNPALFNPVRRPEQTLGRRNVVLYQMVKNNKLSQAEYDSLSQLPLKLNFKRPDHKEGLATYFREYLRMYITASKPELENYRWNKSQYYIDSAAWDEDPLYGWCNKNRKIDGNTYDLYADGLKIYTTINKNMQQYAEDAVQEHLSSSLQEAFDKEREHKNHPPFSNDMTEEEIESIVRRSINQSERGRSMKKAGFSEVEIRSEFEKKIPMQVFTWHGIRDTLMSPLDSLKHYKAFFRAGFMVMNPQQGYVKAYVGGPNYNYFMYDMVSVGKRQVGSTIKPILYTLAMQEGLTPCDRVPNVPQTFIAADGKPWTPRGGKAHEGEMVTLLWGLANSENNISGWVIRQFTPRAVADMAHKMGITSHIDPVPSLFLGTSEISVKEMTAAYSIFANKGVYNRPLIVTRIEDKYGNPLARFRPDSREVMTARTAYLMCKLLEGVVNTGTGIRLRYKYQFKNTMGGKTGTTQNHSDGWFMAITPDLVGGIWVGAEDRSIHFQNISEGQGASVALPIWANFLKKVMDDPSLKFTDRQFDKPVGLNLDINCGQYEEDDDFGTTGLEDYSEGEEGIDEYVPNKAPEGGSQESEEDEIF